MPRLDERLRSRRSTLRARAAEAQRRHRPPRLGWLVAGALATLGGSSMGCGGSANAPRPVMKTVEEPRAVLVIQQALASMNLKAGPGRDLTLGSGKPMYVDVTLPGTEFAIAYLAGLEVGRLAKDLPARTPGDTLRVMRVGDTLVLLLYEDSYEYDTAETHTATAVAAEAKLKRDVSDFVHRAVKGRALK